MFANDRLLTQDDIANAGFRLLKRHVLGPQVARRARALGGIARVMTTSSSMTAYRVFSGYYIHRQRHARVSFGETRAP